MLAPVGVPPELFETPVSSEMRPESLVPPLSAGTARGKWGIGGGSLAGLSGESSHLEDATRPSAIIRNENICNRLAGGRGTSILGNHQWP